MRTNRSHLHRLAFAQVPALHAAGMTPREIATALCVTLFTVHRWLDEHQLPRPTYRAWTVPQVRAAVDRVRAGESMTQVSRALSVPLSTLSHWCEGAGVQSQHLPICQPLTPDPGETLTPDPAA
jgi:IS30 family transposase